MNPDATGDWYKKAIATPPGIVSRKASFEFFQEELAVTVFESLIKVIARTVPSVAGIEKDTPIGPLLKDHFFPRKEGPAKIKEQCIHEINEICKTLDERQLNHILEDLKADYMTPTVAVRRNEELNRLAQSSGDDSENMDSNEPIKKRLRF